MAYLTGAFLYLRDLTVLLHNTYSTWKPKKPVEHKCLLHTRGTFFLHVLFFHLSDFKLSLRAALHVAFSTK